MALCANGLNAVKNVWHKITPELEAILDKVLPFTGVLKNLEQIPAVEAVLKLIPGEPAIETALNVGIDALTQAKEILDQKDAATKLQLFLTDVSTYDPKLKNALLFKLASLIVAVLHGNQNSESDYDTMVQLKAIVMNVSTPAQAA